MGARSPHPGERPAPAGAADLLVVKVGGSCLDELEPAWWDALAATARPARATSGAAPPPAGAASGAAARPTKLVVVHGWSRMVSAATPDGQPDFIVDKHGFRSRYTTAAVLERIVAVATELRERIATVLRERGLAVATADGAASGLLQAEVRQNMWWVGDDLVPLTNLVGPVRNVDRPLLADLHADADAIVVSPLATGFRRSGDAAAGKRDHAGPPDGDAGTGESAGDAGEIPRVNTDADRAAAAIAGAGGAGSLVLVMDAEAFEADGEVVRHATRAELPRLARHAKGGMAKKLRAVEEALAGGVEQVAIGRAPVPDLLAGHAGTLIADPSAVEGGAPPTGVGRRSVDG